MNDAPTFLVTPHADGHRLVTAIDCSAGNTLFSVPLTGLSNVPTRTSIQVGASEHLECGNTLCYMDHSFQPTVAIKVRDGHLAVVALRDLKSGDPLSFDYNTTEAKMACPFTDHETGKVVAGWSSLSLDDKFELRSLAAPWLMA